jgi:hypothetical protein
MSPIHIKYLENMGVRASMSISLTVDNKLWGLISCHGYGLGMRVSLPVRELCRALGDLASTCIEKLIYATRIKARKPLTNAPPKNSPSAYIAASSSDLLNIVWGRFWISSNQRRSTNYWQTLCIQRGNFSSPVHSAKKHYIHLLFSQSREGL